MYYKLVLPLVFISLSWLSLAQNKYVLEADNYFNSEKYCEGAEKCSLAYTKLTRKGSQAKKMKADMAFKTAECYRLTDRFREATEWYERSLLLDYQEVVPEIYYYNGEMLRMMGSFDKALASYEEYSKLVPGDSRGQIAIKSCKDSKNFVANKTRHVIVNQSAINKKEIDMAPMFADRKESKLYFSSSRPGGLGGSDPISCENYMDIWVSDVDKKGNWGEPRLIDKTGLINSEGHEGSVAFDGRGKIMFFTRCPNMKKQNLGCDIWTAEAKGKDEWAEPTKLNLKSNDSVSIGHPCASDDGKFLIFASDMSGGFGGRDLWYTSYDRKSESWATPKNMGPEVNTAGNELFPTFGKDGSLFFASDGMPGLGGLDIYKASKVGEEMKWENPKNLGFPINSENNDYALYELTERKGYFTSERKDPNGKFNPDIYSYEMPPNLFDLKLIVSELGDKNVKIADVKVKVTGTDGSAWEGFTNKQGSVFWDKKSQTERYINENTSYSIAISKEGYHEDKKGAQLTTIGLNYDQNFIIDMALLPKKPIRLPEVRYPLNQWTLLVDSTINSPDSLLFVYNLLQEYPEMVLELSSHTDSRGKNEANQKLSENRAKACYKYLVEQKGVDPRRIVPVGKGEIEPRTIWKKGMEYLSSQPVDMTGVESVPLVEAYINQFKKTNIALYERLHQLNRRTEGKVLRMDFDPAKAPVADPKLLQFVKYP
jgi:outer membrane protein OmpA-like peptidoglycan-associated protein/tetratricopeptide (TPR) repeat protein